MMSQSKVSRGSSISSRASEIGRISSSASLGDAQLGLAVADAGIEADERVVHVFAERHVPHHAHRPEALRGVLGGAVDRVRREHLGDAGERQVGEAAVEESVGMIGRPGRLPDGVARDLEPDRDLGELRSDRLVLDEAPPALHPQLCVVERGLVGGAADPEIEGRLLRDSAARIGACLRGAEQVLRRHPTVRECHVPAAAVPPALAALMHAQSGRVARDQDRARPLAILSPLERKTDLDREQLGKRRVRDPLLDAADDPSIVGARRRGLEARVARPRAVIIDADRRIAVRLVLSERQVIAVVGEERRQEALVLRRRHPPGEQRVREGRRLREHGGDVGIAGGELLGDDAAGEIVGAGPAQLLGERERAQPHPRSLVQRLDEQRTLARFEARRLERERLDRPGDEIAHGVADFQLLGREVKVVHQASPYSPLMPAVLITPAHFSRSLRIRRPSSSGSSANGVTC